MTKRRIQRGFTLIEVAVVMLLIVIVLGLVTVNLEPDREAPVRDEARRLAVLLQTAQQEAILEGKVLALMIEREGYHFMILSDTNEFKPLTDDEVLRARPLPAGMIISSIDIEGAAENEKPRLLLLPTGELPAFTVVFSQGDVRWRVKGSLTGEVTAENAAAPGRWPCWPSLWPRWCAPWDRPSIPRPRCASAMSRSGWRKTGWRNTRCGVTGPSLPRRTANPKSAA
jgi:general secretion pathway protein H